MKVEWLSYATVARGDEFTAEYKDAKDAGEKPKVKCKSQNLI